MKIYGDDGKVYESVEEATQADTAYYKELSRQQRHNLPPAKKIKTAREAQFKAEAEKVVEEAERELKAANENYDKVEEQALKIIEDANDKAEQMLNEATELVKTKATAYRKALSDYCEKYGAYVTTGSITKADKADNKVKSKFPLLDRLINLLYD